MRILITLAVLLLFCLDPLCPAADQSAQELLTTAEQQSSVFRDSSGPFRLDVSFTAQQDIPVQGHLTWLWGANDRWWRTVRLGDFEEVEIRNGEKLYTRVT